ncbi:COPI associated protein-domain-containing protein [Sporodiniella umbellata]|nr:COPI associated protein-domain-containing protein [Sporodiniella umbellata]
MAISYPIVFRVTNIIAAAFMIIGGVMTCIAGGFPNFIQGIFVILFGIMTFVFEFRLPGIITQFASFMFSFMGRGIFYVFLGAITLNYGSLAIASGVIVILIGIAYIVLQFLSIEAPSNMRKDAFEHPQDYNPNNINNTNVHPSNAPYAPHQNNPATVNAETV